MNPICLLLLLSFLVAQESQPAEVTGIVRDDSGNPLADAEVFLAASSQAHAEREVGAREMTDDQGKFSLTIDKQKLKANPYHLMAYKSGYGLNYGYFSSDEPHRPTEICLRPSTSVKLRVVNAQGEPVPNARVRFGGFDHIKFLWRIAPIKDRFDFTTNDVGEVQIEQFVGIWGLIFVVDTKEFGSQICTLGAAPQVEIKLRPVGKIQGRVLGPDGCSAANIEVIVWSPDHGAVGSSYSAAVTNHLGEFEIPAMVVGRARIAARLPADFEFGHPPLGLNVAPNDVTKFELKLERVKRLKGVVRELKSQNPVPNASAWLFIPTQDGSDLIPNVYASQSMMVNESGNYEFSVIPGTYSLRVGTPRGFVGPVDQYRQIEVTDSFIDGETPPVAVVELERAADVFGIVIDENGQPVASASVIASWQQKADPSCPLRQIDTTSNGHGEFTLKDAWCGGPLRITANTETAATAGSTEHWADHHSKLELVVLRSETIQVSGRVVDAQGKSIKARIAVRELLLNNYGQQLETRWLYSGTSVEADDGGVFTLRSGLPRSRSFELLVTAEGFMKSKINLDFTAAIDGELKLADIVLELHKK